MRQYISFQFQTGSIRRHLVNNYSSLKSSFNSKLVRLEVTIGLYDGKEYLIGFQFQTGSIRSFIVGIVIANMCAFQFQTGSIRRGGLLIFMMNFSSFNSKLVRLEVLRKLIFQVRSSYVSIPNWFD